MTSHGFDLLVRHEVREAHRGEEFGANFVRRAGIRERREQVFPARCRDAVDLAVRLAFLRNMPAFDQPVPSQCVERRVYRAVARSEKVAERRLEFLFQVIARGFAIREHAETDGFYIHYAFFRRPVSTIYRVDVLYYFDI